MARKKRKKKIPNILRDFEIKFQGYDLHVYILDNDDWVIECEEGVEDLNLFADVRTYAELEGFADDLT